MNNIANNNNNNNLITEEEYNDATDTIEGALWLLCALPADFHSPGHENDILARHLQTTGLFRGVCRPSDCKVL